MTHQSPYLANRWLRRIIFAIPLVTIAAALAVGLWRVVNSPSFQFFGQIVPRVETTEPVIALTLDDGPTSSFTHEILQLLAEKDVRATFFLIGSEIERNPEETRSIIAAGHDVGNHSFSHKRMRLVTPGFVADEIERTDRLIRDAGYERPITFRPPYGEKLFVLPWYLSQNSRTTVTWDIAPESDFAGDTQAIADHILRNARGGSVIVLHVMYDRRRASMKAVGLAIDGLRSRGFRFVTISELLAMQ